MRYSIILIALVAIAAFGTIAAKKNMQQPMDTQQMTGQQPMTTQKAMFAGGCFWCMEKPFEQLDGVISVISGYAGGTTRNPTYKTYSQGGHIEVVEITYDPGSISYNELLDVYWRQIDPTDPGGQFVDRGHAYTTAIFYYNEKQKIAAEKSKKLFDQSGIFGKPIVTPIMEAAPFYPAEEYHQDYYKKNPIRYRFYRGGSGRDTYLKSVWDNVESPPRIDKSQLKKKLTPMQYDVTQNEGTEPPFKNTYWDNKKPGIYVDIVSGEPLFSSKDKYDSGTGWPSFSRPLVPGNIVEKKDNKLFYSRTEVRSKEADSHLGHVFEDGPAPTGLRYCINSAALRFIPVNKLAQEGYHEWLKEFF